MSNEKGSMQAADRRQVTVIRVTEDGAVRHGKSTSIYGFPHMGKLCRDYLRREKSKDDMTLDDSLPASRIYEEEFSEAVQQFGGRKDLRAVFDINLDEQLLSVLGGSGAWTTYPLKAVTVAAYHAYNDGYRSPEHTIALFFEHIKGKGIQLPPEEASLLPSMGM